MEECADLRNPAGSIPSTPEKLARMPASLGFKGFPSTIVDTPPRVEREDPHVVDRLVNDVLFTPKVRPVQRSRWTSVS